MKRKHFFLISIVACIVLIVACNNDKSKESTTSTQGKKDSAKAVFDRGKYLVYSVVNCVDCYSMLDTSKFSAPVVPDTEGGGGRWVGLS